MATVELVKKAAGRPPAMHLDLFCPEDLSPPPGFEPWDESLVLSLREGVLYDALQTVFDGRAMRESRSEALRWILSDGMGPFSYRVCCAAVGVDPDELRESFVALGQHRGEDWARLNLEVVER